LGILTLTGGGGGSFGGLAVVSKIRLWRCDAKPAITDNVDIIDGSRGFRFNNFRRCNVTRRIRLTGPAVSYGPSWCLLSVTAKCSLESVKGDGSAHGCAAECAVRFEPVCANTGFFDTSVERFRVG